MLAIWFPPKQHFKQQTERDAVIPLNMSNFKKKPSQSKAAKQPGQTAHMF